MLAVNIIQNKAADLLTQVEPRADCRSRGSHRAMCTGFPFSHRYTSVSPKQCLRDLANKTEVQEKYELANSKRDEKEVIFTATKTIFGVKMKIVKLNTSVI